MSGIRPTLSIIAGLMLPVMSVHAEVKSTMVDDLANASYKERQQILDVANQAARSKGLTLESLGKACNLLPIRVGSAVKPL